LDPAGAIARSTLPGGIRVVTERMPGSRSVTTGFWVGVGARDEPGEVQGASHFLEHLLFKGTEARTARQIAEAVDAVGGEMNAFTTKEYTAYYTRLPEGQLDLGLDILSDVLWAPAFRANELEAERQVILEELLMHEDTPDDRVFTVLAEALFPGHALGREVLGDRSTIEAMSREDLRHFHGSWYRPVNLVVAVAGHVDHETVVDGVQRRFAGVEGGEAPKRSAPAREPQPISVLRRPTEQAHVALGMPSLARDDEDRYALAVLNQVLGGGMSSRLFQEIREERGLAYSVFSSASTYSDGGALTIYAGTGPARVVAVLDLIDAELDRMLQDGITYQELQVATGCLEGSTVLGLEDSAGRMSRIGKSELVLGEVIEMDELIARFRAVTLHDVQRVAERLLTGPRSLAVVGPFDAAEFQGRMAS